MSSTFLQIVRKPRLLNQLLSYYTKFTYQANAQYASFWLDSIYEIPIAFIVTHRLREDLFFFFLAYIPSLQMIKLSLLLDARSHNIITN